MQSGRPADEISMAGRFLVAGDWWLVIVSGDW